MTRTDDPEPQPPTSGCRENDPEFQSRRRFLAWISGGLGAVAALMASIPLVGFLFSPLLRREPNVWRAVGAADEFTVGETVMVRYVDSQPLPWAGYAGRSAAWLRRDAEGSFTVFSMYCTHAGCPVTWTGSANLFMCPCHGGVFNRDGSVAAGPPRRPLERLPVRVREGMVEVRTQDAARRS